MLGDIYVAFRYIAQAETLENDAIQLENEADIWERGCRND